MRVTFGNRLGNGILSVYFLKTPFKGSLTTWLVGRLKTMALRRRELCMAVNNVEVRRVCLDKSSEKCSEETLLEWNCSQ